MKTKFLYLLIIVFSISLTSCRKRKAENGLVGTWDITTETESGIFYLNNKGNGHITLINNSNGELIYDIQVNKLNVTSHMNNGYYIGDHWHTYQGEFYTEEGNYTYFTLRESRENDQIGKVSKESQDLEMDIQVFDGDTNYETPFLYGLQIIMSRQ